MASGARMADPIYRGTLQSLCVLVHCIGVVQNWYAIYYDYTYVHFPYARQSTEEPLTVTNNRNFGGKFKFLTFLNAVSN